MAARNGAKNIFSTSLYIQCMRLAITPELKEFYNLTWEECMKFEGRDMLKNKETRHRIKDAWCMTEKEYFRKICATHVCNPYFLALQLSQEPAEELQPEKEEAQE